MFSHKTAIQAVDYIIKNSADDSKILDKLTIVKLLFFAERYSLRKYAKSIAEDDFYATRGGHITSKTYDLISFKDYNKEATKYTNLILEKIEPYFVKSREVLLTIEDYDGLSEADIEALDFSIKEFGQYSSKKLANITHGYKEWNRFKTQLQEQDTSFKMDINDFFEPTTETTRPYALIPDEYVNLNKEIVLYGEFK